jgi:hypothetical protein
VARKYREGGRSEKLSANERETAEEACMTSVRSVVLVFLLSHCATTIADSSGVCDKSGPRVTDNDAIRIARVEVSKRVKEFDPSKYIFSVEEDVCDLRVNVEKKDQVKTGRHSVLILDRAGVIKRYFGGM